MQSTLSILQKLAPGTSTGESSLSSSPLFHDGVAALGEGAGIPDKGGAQRHQGSQPVSLWGSEQTSAVTSSVWNLPNPPPALHLPSRKHSNAPTLHNELSVLAGVTSAKREMNAGFVEP